MNTSSLESRRVGLKAILLATIVIFLMQMSGFGEIIPADRRIDWSGAGVSGGIPSVPVFANVKNAPYNAKGDGVTDDTVAITSAVKACPEGQAVYFPAGAYKTAQITTDKGIVLRGAGAGTTIIKASIMFARYFSGGIFDNALGSGSIANITAGATRGSNSVTVDNARYMQVGAYVELAGEDPAICNDVGGEGATYSPAQGQISRITAVNGKTITFTPALFWGFPTLAKTSISYNNSHPNANFIQHAGIENLTISNDGGGYAIWMEHCANSWVKDSEITNWQIAAIRCLFSTNCQFSGNYIHDTRGSGSGGGYGILLEGKVTRSLIENNISNQVTTSWMCDHGSCANVFAYNYSNSTKYYQADWQSEDFSSHRGHPIFNLWEGNVGFNLYGDDIHGSCSHHTLFRNQFKGWQSSTITGQNVAAAFQAYNYYMNVVGCVLGTAGQTKVYEVASPGSDQYAVYYLGAGSTSYDPKVKATLYRHGNYDYVNKSTIWDPTNTDHQLPASLYLPSKPSWWGSLPWPAIGPDLSPMIGMIPAQQRFGAMKSGTAKLAAPANLRTASH